LLFNEAHTFGDYDGERGREVGVGGRESLTEPKTALSLADCEICGSIEG